MIALLVPCLIALGAVVVKAVPWRRLEPERRATLHRVGAVSLLVAVGWLGGAASTQLGNPPWVIQDSSLTGLATLRSLALSASATTAIIAIAFWMLHRTQQVRSNYWWRRTEWALEWAAQGSDDPRSAVGLAAIAYQLRSHDATSEDADLLSGIADRLSAGGRPSSTGSDATPHDETG